MDLRKGQNMSAYIKNVTKFILWLVHLNRKLISTVIFYKGIFFFTKINIFKEVLQSPFLVNK